jgi:predicted O-methyltransferase YrrM
MNEPVFSSDWFSGGVPLWTEHFGHLADKTNARFLEVGSWEGRSAHWIATNLLGAGSTLDCVDTWRGSAEHDPNIAARTWDAFQKNLRSFLSDGRVVAHRGKSTEILPGFIAEIEKGKRQTYDFIYIDGSHATTDVFIDACLAFLLVKPGGFIVFDDYPSNGPALAIDSAMKCLEGKYELVFVGWQIAIRKTACGGA